MSHTGKTTHFEVTLFPQSNNKYERLREAVESFLNSGVDDQSRESCHKGPHQVVLVDAETPHEEQALPGARGETGDGQRRLIYLNDLTRLFFAPTAPTREVPDVAAGLDGGTMLFLSQQPHLDPVEEPDDSKTEGYRYLKWNQLYIRTLCSYGFGTYVDCPAPTSPLDISKNPARVLLPPAGERRRAGGEGDNYVSLRGILEQIRRDCSSGRVPFAHTQPTAESDYSPVSPSFAQLRADVEKLRRIAESELGPDPENLLAGFTLDPQLFVADLAALYQLSRLGSNRAEEIIDLQIAWLRKAGGSYGLADTISKTTRELLRQRWTDHEYKMKLEELKSCEIRRHSYEVARDLARCLASAALNWPRRAATKIRILLIDPLVEADKLELKTRLIRIAELMGNDIQFDVATQEWSAIYSDLQTKHTIQVQRLAQEGLVGEVERLDIFDYGVVFTEIEFNRRVIGARVIRELDNYLDARARRERKAAPRLMVITRSEHAGRVHLCLSLGAEGYLLKHRLYNLPNLLAQVPPPPLPLRPEGRKSNFLKLYELLPQHIELLRSQEPAHLISGQNTPHSYVEWLRKLPKADLHFHIGTTISLKTIEALAFNTAGYLCAQFGGRLPSGEKLDGPATELMDLIVRIWTTVLRAGLLRNHGEDLVLCMVRSAKRGLKRKDLTLPRNFTPEDFNDEKIYQSLIAALSASASQITPYEITALLVCVMCAAGRMAEHGPGTQPQSLEDLRTAVRVGVESALPDPQSGVSDVMAEWKYLEELGIFEEAWKNKEPGENGEKIQWVKSLVANAGALTDSVRQSMAVVARRNQGAVAAGSAGGAAVWGELHEEVKTRVDATAAVIRGGLVVAFDRLMKELGDEKGYIRAYERWFKNKQTGNEPLQPKFEQLIQVPEPQSSFTHSLQRYLCGAELLGAEHLQYPENLLLAGRDIIRQAVDDNILYGEMRCETTGYCRAGMNKMDATRLLCLSMDLANAYNVYSDSLSNSESGDKWRRVNILLGAKRHKTPEECRNIVSLLVHCLESGAARGENHLEFLPRWWRPSCVVGFDLSGDETRDVVSNFREIFTPLRDECVPITVHAGEASSAESIWRAVYEYNSRRIGHGLRLRENRGLLTFCANENVAMEMCPKSNMRTNVFRPMPPPTQGEQTGETLGKERQYYPLRYFMEEGLDVCISTDNRQLHDEGSLTNEYLCAGEWVGGLTRWQVLKIIRSGFKNAFLPKVQIVEFLRHVEAEVYEQTAKTLPGAE